MTGQQQLCSQTIPLRRLRFELLVLMLSSEYSVEPDVSGALSYHLFVSFGLTLW